MVSGLKVKPQIAHTWVIITETVLHITVGVRRVLPCLGKESIVPVDIVAEQAHDVRMLHKLIVNSLHTKLKAKIGHLRVETKLSLLSILLDWRVGLIRGHFHLSTRLLRNLHYEVVESISCVEWDIVPWRHL